MIAKVGDLVDRRVVERLPNGSVVQRATDEHGGPYAEMLVWGGLIGRRVAKRGERVVFGRVGTASEGWLVVSLPG
jgi:hypothetical protein